MRPWIRERKMEFWLFEHMYQHSSRMSHLTRPSLDLNLTNSNDSSVVMVSKKATKPVIWVQTMGNITLAAQPPARSRPSVETVSRSEF